MSRVDPSFNPLAPIAKQAVDEIMEVLKRWKAVGLADGVIVAPNQLPPELVTPAPDGGTPTLNVAAQMIFPLLEAGPNITIAMNADNTKIVISGTGTNIPPDQINYVMYNGEYVTLNGEYVIYNP